jgi:type I restriction enzyme S subunit
MTPASDLDYPSEWTLRPLGEVIRDDRQTLNPQNHPDETFEYYSIPAYQEDQRPVEERGDAIRSLKLLVEPHTVLFGKLNPRVSKVWFVKKGSGMRRLASTEFIPLRAVGDVDPQYLYYLAWSDHLLAPSRELVSGSTPSRQRVDLLAFLRLEVPVPPLPEQRAIAYVLSRVQRAKEATEQVIDAAQDLKLSFVSTYVARGEPLETWLVQPIGELASRVEYGISKRGGKTGAYPILRMNSISDGQVESDDLQWVDLAPEEFHRFRLARGDVLFNRTNSIEKVGKAAYFDLDGDWVFASYLLRIVAKPDVLEPRFLNYFLGAPATRARLKQLATRAVSQANINATKLRGLTMPVPPILEQSHIADTVQAVDRKIAAEVARRDALATLLDSLLHDLMTARLRVTDPEIPE